MVEDIHAGRGLVDLIIAPEQLVASNRVVSPQLIFRGVIQFLGNQLDKSLTVVELGVPGGGMDVFLRQLGWKYEVGSFLNEQGESLRVQWDLLGGRVTDPNHPRLPVPLAGHLGRSQLGPRKCDAFGAQLHEA